MKRRVTKADLRPFYRRFARRVKRARVAAGLSQGELGRRMGLTRSAICNVESGRFGVTLPNLLLMSKMLRVSCDELIGR